MVNKSMLSNTYNWFYNTLDCFTVMKQSFSVNQFEYLLNDKETASFHFSNGTIVHAKDLENAKELMKNTLNNYNGKYWATEIDNNTWEVQYSLAALSAVYVKIDAPSAQEASMKALKSITNDLNALELTKVL